MPDIPINARPYQLFVSYAHEDHKFVSALVHWLTVSAGLSIWHDERKLQAGASVGTDLPAAIRLATGALFVISNAAGKSGWVREEYNAALEQRAAHREYRILVLRIDDAEPPGFLRTTKWLDVPGAVLTPDVGIGILLGIYADSAGTTRKDRDLYLSRSWRSTEAELPETVARTLIGHGYRLIGDATDHKDYDADGRIPSLVASCSALIAVAPDRGGRTSPFIEDEIRIALDLGVPCAVLIEAGVVLSDAITARLPEGCLITAADSYAPDAAALLADVVREMFKPAKKPHYAFYATSLLKSPELTQNVQELVDAVTGIDCIVGINLEGQHAQREIIRSIQGALFMVADITEERGVNTLIEAGVALGAGTRLHLLAHGEPRPARFMFRDMEVRFYRDELELIGSIHRIARPYRRRILNRELQDQV